MEWMLTEVVQCVWCEGITITQALIKFSWLCLRYQGTGGMANKLASSAEVVGGSVQAGLL